jgi:ABC-2 type transport system ATP-binding protein
LDEVEKVCTHVVVLRKGEILYSGLVGGMASNEGFFELQADDNENLSLVLKKHPAVKSVANEGGKVLVYLKHDWDAKELNQFLFEKSIVLSHLVKRKNSLEEQFLELTNNTKPTIKN